jgi:hypothetical protein
MKSATNNKRLKQLKKLEKLSTKESNGSTQKTFVIIAFLLFFLSAFFVVDILSNDLFIHYYLVCFIQVFIPLGLCLIFRCDFRNFNFNGAKKILDSYEPINKNKKKYDYLINTEKNNEFFWERLDKFIASEQRQLERNREK